MAVRRTPYGGESCAGDRLVVVGSRVGAAFVAVLCATVLFGIIDLTVVPDYDVRFDRFLLLETGWGLLFTFGPTAGLGREPAPGFVTELILVSGVAGSPRVHITAAEMEISSKGVKTWLDRYAGVSATSENWPRVDLVVDMGI